MSYQASRLGVPEAEINAASAAPSSSPYRPYRGRGFRTRGFFRGGTRGGPPRASMKLDNRPRKLLIQGVPANDEAVQAVRNHYQVCKLDFLCVHSRDNILVLTGHG